MNADLLFRCRFGRLLESAIGNIEKKFAEAQRAAELSTGNDTLNQNRPGISI
jgi:hypothetical protein